MKRAFQATFVMLLGAVAMMTWPAVRAHWDAEEPAKWVQLPDPGLDGQDVCASAPLTLADDFQCTNTETIASVHIWGSWRLDEVPVGGVSNVTFRLAFCEDIPGPPYSRPGEVLWRGEFPPGSFTVRKWWVRPEAWYNPSTREYLEAGDTNCWQYNFYFPPTNRFEQSGSSQAPKIYWLLVQAIVTNSPAQFGWKKALDHWGDYAAWQPAEGLPWNELKDINGVNSLDLAFVVVGSGTASGTLDFGDAPLPYPTLLLNGARHVIGGPWFGNDDDGHADAPDAEPDGQPHPLGWGDDAMTVSGYDDEDGVRFPQTIVHGVTTNYTVIVNSVDGLGGFVSIWLDVNGDKTWTGDELILSTHLVNGTYQFPIMVNTGGMVGATFARCRISTSQIADPQGLAPDGEVEDHNVILDDGYVDWCNLQWPPATTTSVGVATELIYGQVWVPGVTDQPGQGQGIIAQLGYGPDGTDPATNSAWVWKTADYNPEFSGNPNNDEYMATLTITTPGRYDYAYRFSRNGIQWTYGDYGNGSADGYDVTNAGDLVVLGVETEPEPKWSQNPDCELGIDIQSWGNQQGGSMLPTTVVADDWYCDGRPVTAIEWWGSYLGWESDTKEEVPPPLMERPIGFYLSWFTDIPAGGQEWSRPGNLLTNVFVYLAPFGGRPNDPTQVMETHYCVSDLSRLQPGNYGFEHEYRYYVKLPEPWFEKEGQIYWLSVLAVYGQEVSGEHRWGWKTISPNWNWNDDAVFSTDGMRTWREMHYPPPVEPWAGITNHQHAGQSVNMAFRLYTDIVPRRAKKWRQPPDMLRGVNMPSFAVQGSPELSLRADDFVSDGRPITDIHWWGSYLGWREQDPGPVPPPAGLFAPTGFIVSWHADIPAGVGGQAWSMPSNPPLREIFVPLSKCHEVYYGTVTQDWSGTTFEHEFQYYVDLLDPEIESGPWSEEAGVIYWLNIQAVFPFGAIEPDGPHRGWGWKTTPPEYHWQDVSVVANIRGPDGPIWRPGEYPEGHPYGGGTPMDLAFELTTDRPGTNRWYGPIWFTNAMWVGSDHYCAVSIGDAGAGHQYLEKSLDLRASNWVAVATNVAPFPPPWSNVWQHAGTTNAFFRIRQR